MFIWNVLGQRGGTELKLGAGNIPGYGPVEALDLLDPGSAPLYWIDEGGTTRIVEIQGNLVRMIHPQGVNPDGTPLFDVSTGVSRRIDTEGSAREVQYRQVDAVTYDGRSTRTVWAEPDSSTGRLDGAPVPIYEVQLADNPDWRAFTTRPGENTAANELLRQRYAGLDRAALQDLGIDARIIDYLVDTTANANPGPDGFTWHHDVATGVHQLVDRRLHTADSDFFGLRHSGGRKVHGEDLLRANNSTGAVVVSQAPLAPGR